MMIGMFVLIVQNDVILHVVQQPKLLVDVISVSNAIDHLVQQLMFADTFRFLMDILKSLSLVCYI